MQMHVEDIFISLAETLHNALSWYSDTIVFFRQVGGIKIMHEVKEERGMWNYLENLASSLFKRSFMC